MHYLVRKGLEEGIKVHSTKYHFLFGLKVAPSTKELQSISRNRLQNQMEVTQTKTYTPQSKILNTRCIKKVSNLEVNK